MNTQILVQKLNNDVKELKDDIKGIKNLLFAPLKDTEGDYSKLFVKKMFARSKRNRPFYQFANKETFLKHEQISK